MRCYSEFCYRTFYGYPDLRNALSSIASSSKRFKFSSSWANTVSVAKTIKYFIVRYIYINMYPSQQEQTYSAISSQDFFNWADVIEFLKAVARSVVTGLIIFKAVLTNLQGVEAVTAASSYAGVV
jgi:hypothetical protein